MRIPVPPVPLTQDVVDLAAEYSSGRRVPAEPRDAATVVLTRSGSRPGAGPDVYLLRRQTSMDFAAGMCVFPGGGVDRRDFDAGIAWAGPSPARWAQQLACQEDLARALVCAAVRETFEESGVLLAGEHEDSVVADTTGADWEADRVALETRELAMTDFLARRGLVLRTDLLGVWGAWVTPVFEPKRYRTWFLTARLPEGQRTRDVSMESSSVTWLPALAAAEQVEAGAMLMMPPTYLTCLEVAQHAGPDEVLAAARDREVTMHCPSVEPSGEDHVLSIPEHQRPVLEARLGVASRS